jgi:hypothetical protein
VAAAPTALLYGGTSHGSTDGWIVGSSGTILHWDGARMSAMTSPTTVMLYGVWGTGPTNVWAVGEAGTILHRGNAAPTLPGGTCAAPVELSCGASLFGSNAGAPTTFNTYSCASGNELGREVYYRWEAPFTGSITVTLHPFTANLDLIAVEGDPWSGCTPAGAGCVDASQNTGSAADAVTVDVQKGETYFFIVDAPTTTPSGYQISATCVRD